MLSWASTFCYLGFITTEPHPLLLSKYATLCGKLMTDPEISWLGVVSKTTEAPNNIKKCKTFYIFKLSVSEKLLQILIVAHLLHTTTKTDS